MSTLAPILLLTAASGALSALIAGVFMLLPAARRMPLLPHLVSFATGALLGAALLALLPHALDAGAARTASASRSRPASSLSSCWRSWCSGATATWTTAKRTARRTTTAIAPPRR